MSSFGTKDVNITLPISGNAVASMMIGLLSGDTLHIQVIQDLSQTGTVLRLNQIMSPDWKLDGPFSDNYDFSATESGTYMFIIGENLMAAEAKYT